MTGIRDSHGDKNIPGSSVYNDALTAATDRCVKCALCLPHCPTYARNATETQSPRGRVTLVAALAGGALMPDDARAALDSCLSCRACEQVCPARVEYGSILDRGKALLGTPSRGERRVAAVLRNSSAMSLLGVLWRATRWLPMPARLRRWQALPGVASAGVPRRVAKMPTGAPITVLIGCLSGDFDRAAVAAYQQLFAAVDRPCVFVATCCGALDQHSGARARAATQAQALLRTIPADDSPIVHLASGCAAAVRDISHHSTSDQAKRISARVTDPFVLLESLGINERLTTAANTVTQVALHLPCTQRNVLRGGAALERLIASLDGVAAKTLTGHGCCGAAGTHMLREPAAAADFATRVLSEAPDGAEILLSANIGCAWHLRGTLFDQGRTLAVEHPAVFLARHLTSGAA